MKSTRVKKPSSRNRAKPTPSANQSREVLKVGGREIPVSRLNKVFYPKSGFTKAQVIDYYIRVSPVLLPHLKDRPLTLKRYPDGVEGGFFYEKRCPPYRPEWLKTAAVWSEQNEDEIHYCLANDLPSIVWAANLGDLELHTFLARANDVKRPTMLVFDLDPGPPANILQCVEVGLLLRKKLGEYKLESFPKTSGSKGLQIYVPLNTPVTYEVTKPFARYLAEQLQAERPDLVVSRMEKKLRGGKVFVDWSQNDEHKTTVCVYSLRAKEQPTASTPLEWDEVEAAGKKKSIERLTFLSDQVLKRVEKHGDLFEPVLKLKQKVPEHF
jgi:bifunctional non-homologous end joining protein LigD